MIGFVYERLYDDDGCVMPYSEDSFNMIRCPYGNVQVWVQEKYKITGLTEKSGDTTNIGSITRNSIDDFANGNGPFSSMDKIICNDYWRNFKKNTTYRTVEEYFIWAKENSELSINLLKNEEEKYVLWRREKYPSYEDLLMMAQRVIHAKGPRGGEKGLWVLIRDVEIKVTSDTSEVSECISYCNEKGITIIEELR